MMESLKDPEIDLIEIGKCVFICARDFVASENNAVMI